MEESRYALILSALAAAIVAGSCVQQETEPRYTPGTPVRRSIERIHKSTSPEPGTFWSCGYTTFLKGLPISDLFVDSDRPQVLNHKTARFTHVEEEQTCHLYTIPSDFAALPLPTPLTLPSGLPDYPVITTTVRARHVIYYNDTPPARDWDVIDGFKKGTVVAVYDLVDETDSIDPLEGVGVGNVVAYLRESTPVTLKSGNSFDFADFGDRLYAEFHFQARPIPLGSTAVAAPNLPTSGAAPPLISRFRDSGVWMTMPAIGPIPTPGVGPCPP